MNKLIEEHDGHITVRNEGFKEMKPEEVGANQLNNGSATEAFMFWLDNWSDIQDHLQRIYEKSRGIVLELGTRGGISTSALLYGIEKHGGHVTSVDYNPFCEEAFKGHPNWTFVCSDSCDFNKILAEAALYGPFDLLFIDTEHTYERLKRELSIWGPYVRRGGTILMHDVLAYPEMAVAAREYAEANKLEYKIHPGSNGLGEINC